MKIRCSGCRRPVSVGFVRWLRHAMRPPVPRSIFLCQSECFVSYLNQELRKAARRSVARKVVR